MQKGRNSAARTIGDFMGIIETRNLTKYYGKSKGIENLNMSIEEGEIYGFIGPNGAGKSTTIRTLLTLIYPTSGEATIFGKEVVTHKTEILQEVGYLPSEVFYYDNMKVIDLLNYSASFYRKDCSARIRELAARLDLNLKKKIDDLSYGNRKKVGIVQGLLHSPKVIMLDEPTGGLDPLMQQTFFDIVLEENQRGATVLFSSHILSEVQKMCDRVAIIKDGSIIKVESMNDMRRANYKRVALTFANDNDASNFSLPGATDLLARNGGVDFIFKGDVKSLIGGVAHLDLIDLEITEPDLEDVFMHYYSKDE